MSGISSLTSEALFVRAPDPGKWLTCKQIDWPDGVTSHRQKVTINQKSAQFQHTTIRDECATVTDLLMWFEIGRVPTEYGERMNMRPQHAPVGRVVPGLVTQPLKDVEHVLEISSFQLEKITTADSQSYMLTPTRSLSNQRSTANHTEHMATGQLADRPTRGLLTLSPYTFGLISYYKFFLTTCAL